MAIIQNSAVIQKLVDELELSPSLEKIPTELAEKVLPVFQVNSEQLTVQMKPNYILWQDVAPNDSDKTLTVPDGHTYAIKHGLIKLVTTATVGNRILEVEIKDAAGNTIWVIEQPNADVTIASKTNYWRVNPNSIIGEESAVLNNHIIFNFPIPQDFIMLEKWTIQIHDSAAVAAAADDLEVSFIVDDMLD